ncbi:hypothetical protein QTN25_007809 [Entamoeba marina]
MDEIEPLVIDVGTSSVKALYGGQTNITTTFPTVVGTSKVINPLIGIDIQSSYVGEEALSKSGVLKLNYPLSNGLITNWNDMEQIWYHTIYYKLKRAPGEHPVVLSHSHNTSQNDLKKTIQIMFESFDVPCLSSFLQEQLSMYSTGKSNGITVQCGESGCTIIPIIDGKANLKNKEVVNVTGNDMNDYFALSLIKNGLNINFQCNGPLITQQREQFCYVSQDYFNEIQHIQPKLYKLPDDSMLKIDDEMITCPEALFNPKVLNINDDGIHTSTIQVLSKYNNEISNELINNILLCGGNCMYNGCIQRFENEMLISTNKTIKTLQLPNDIQKQFSTAIGGSIISTLSSFEKYYILVDDYNEYGSNLVEVWC